jgi:hypothetical protein
MIIVWSGSGVLVRTGRTVKISSCRRSLSRLMGFIKRAPGIITIKVITMGRNGTSQNRSISKICI